MLSDHPKSLLLHLDLCMWLQASKQDYRKKSNAEHFFRVTSVVLTFIFVDLSVLRSIYYCEALPYLHSFCLWLRSIYFCEPFRMCTLYLWSFMTIDTVWQVLQIYLNMWYYWFMWFFFCICYSVLKYKCFR